jgi:outer membrane immunogenic protein
MKKLLLSASVLALSTGAALAAPPSPPPPLWTGFYAGLNAGYGFGTNSATQSVSTGEIAYDSDYRYNDALFGQQLLIPTGIGLALSGVGAQSQSGFIGGGQLGYNYQYGLFVFGFEADIQGAGIRGSSRTGGLGAGYGVDSEGFSEGATYTSAYTSIGRTHVNAGVDWMGTVRGRVGYLWTPTMLIFATGGLTYGGVYANVVNYGVTTNAWTDNFSEFGSGTLTKTFVGGGSRSQTLVGWNVGGGVEWMFLPNWSLKAEGLYWNMGNMNVPTATFAAAPLPGGPFWENQPSTTFGVTRVNYQGVIARLGLNYHFNWGGGLPY